MKLRLGEESEERRLGRQEGLMEKRLNNTNGKGGPRDED